jgi:hypothetical protein
LPGCSRTAPTSTMHDRKNRVYRTYNKVLNHLLFAKNSADNVRVSPVIYYFRKTLGIQTCTAYQCPVNVCLFH